MTYESHPPSDPSDPPEFPGPAEVPPDVTEGESRALDAFRAARDAGAHAPVPPWRRRRRRDDWRPAGRRRGVRSVRLVLGGLTAAVALGGVAVAAGAGVIPAPFGGGSGPPDSVRPVRTAPATPDERPRQTEVGVGPGSATATATPGPGRATGGGPAPGDDALCTAYRKAGKNGKAADAAAFDRLVAAAGGESAVPGYCEEILGRPSPEKTGDAPGARGKERKSAEPARGGANSGGNANGGNNANSGGSGDSGGNANSGGSANGDANGNGNPGKPSTG